MRNRYLCHGLEYLGSSEHMADVDPQHQIPIVRLAELVFQLRDPPIRIYLDSIIQLETIDEMRDLSERLELDGAWYFGTPTMDGVQHNRYGFRIEALSKREMNAPVGLGTIALRIGMLDPISKDTGREGEMAG